MSNIAGDEEADGFVEDDITASLYAVSHRRCQHRQRDEFEITTPIRPRMLYVQRIL